MKRITNAAALAVTSILSACGEAADAPAEEQVEGTLPGLTITNARMVLAPVEGNPAAVYFDLAYEGDKATAIRSAEVANAKSAELHATMEWIDGVEMGETGPIKLAKGTKETFEPGGKHVMAFEPSTDLKPGGKAEVSLVIIGGDKHTFEADIVAAGDER